MGGSKSDGGLARVNMIGFEKRDRVAFARDDKFLGICMCPGTGKESSLQHDCHVGRGESNHDLRKNCALNNKLTIKFLITRVFIICCTSYPTNLTFDANLCIF